MELAGKKMLVWGLGLSGFAVARFLRERGARVTVTDAAPKKRLGEYPQKLKQLGIPLEAGVLQPKALERAERVVISPGVPHTLPPLEAARKRGIPVIGEVELASRFIREPMVAVTGTNGKTTTTELLGRMLAGCGLKVFVGGNIGLPLIEYVREGKPADCLVVELSSFQLDTIHRFRPHVAVLLNISPDHLDRYPDFHGYAESKARIFENQKADDIAVLNGRDPAILDLAANGRIRGKPLFFNARADQAGAYTDQDRVILNIPQSPPGQAGRAISPGFGSGENRAPATGQAETGSGLSLDIARTGLTGSHNRENIAAAALAALAAGGNIAGVQEAIQAFGGLPHRLQAVATVAGVRYYNDSKATNPDAVARALEGFSRPVLLILGGQGKNCDFGYLRDAVAGHVKAIVAIGETRPAIQKTFADLVPVEIALDLPDAVGRCHWLAAAGDAVLLSPACASFDMFSSYAQRGEVFCQAVRNLQRVWEG